MNRSNVLEVKKTLKISENDIPSIDTICTCFVNGNKEKLISNTEKFATLEEEEQFKYIEILKNVLTGAIGKKLLNLNFSPVPRSKESRDNMASWEKTIFENETERNTFFSHIISNLGFDENYLLVAAHGIYDAPIKASDGAKLEDETNTYDFMITAVCPVHSTKAGLTLDSKKGRMVSADQIQIIEAPVNGFLYPAFNERESDEDALLYYSKKPEESHPEFIEALMGYESPTLSTEQQRIFEKIVAEVTDDNADMELVKSLQENLTTMVEESESSSDDKILTKDDVKEVLKNAGVSSDKLQDFDHIYERAGGNSKTDFNPQNLIELGKFKLKTPDVEIKIKPDKRQLIRQEQIKGKNCIVIEIESDKIELNGIQLKS